jgi:hypothetical protein
MIPAYERDAVGVANFEGEEKEESFDRVKATVDKVTWKWLVDGIECKTEEQHSDERDN